jgi:hypothetical protein
MKTKLDAIYALFSEAVFSQNRFGGIPIPNLSKSARANHKKNWTGTPHRQTWHKMNGARECSRRLAFKERHGHFPGNGTFDGGGA